MKNYKIFPGWQLRLPAAFLRREVTLVLLHWRQDAEIALMEDTEIVNMYWARNSDAIQEAETKYGSYCRSIARNILGNNEDVEECVNDTYLTLGTQFHLIVRKCCQHSWAKLQGIYHLTDIDIITLKSAVVEKSN